MITSADFIVQLHERDTKANLILDLQPGEFGFALNENAAIYKTYAGAVVQLATSAVSSQLITGSGTIGTLTKFSAGTVLTDSRISESGSEIFANGNLTALTLVGGTLSLASNALIGNNLIANGNIHSLASLSANDIQTRDIVTFGNILATGQLQGGTLATVSNALIGNNVVANGSGFFSGSVSAVGLSTSTTLSVKTNALIGGALNVSGIFSLNSNLSARNAAFSVGDNATGVFLVAESSNEYIRLNTSNSSESLRFGNATTNNNTQFLGTGYISFSGPFTNNPTYTSAVFNAEMTGIPYFIGRDGANVKYVMHPSGFTVVPASTFSGAVTMGSTLNVSGSASINSNILVNGMMTSTIGTAGSTNVSLVANTNNSNAGSGAQFRATVGGGSSGDPSLYFLIGSGGTASIGLDNDDSDKFKISMSSGLGTQDAFTIDNSSLLTTIKASLKVEGSYLALPQGISDPGSPAYGWMYWNTNSNHLRLYTPAFGGSWVDLY
jgi:hypothetical protein